MFKIMDQCKHNLAQARNVLGIRAKKRNKNPTQISDAKYPGKREKQSTLSVIDFDPRPVKYREVKTHHINNFLSNIQLLSQAEGGEMSMWGTQLNFTYNDYNLKCERRRVLFEQVSALYNNLKPEALMEIPGTQEQSKSEKWFSERWSTDSIKVSFYI